MAEERQPDRVDGVAVLSFPTAAELWAWLETRELRGSDPGVWVRLRRSGSPLPSVTFHEVLEAGIAFGWSESARRAYDAGSYLQRFTPRRTSGTTSSRNLAIAERLIAEGRMRDAGRLALGLGPQLLGRRTLSR